MTFYWISCCCACEGFYYDGAFAGAILIVDGYYGVATTVAYDDISVGAVTTTEVVVVP